MGRFVAVQLSDAEWKVMNAVWEGTPASARDVLERLGDENSWAYTTVKTMLSRLAEKGALSVRKRANTSLYEPKVSRDAAQRSAVRGLLERAFGGRSAPLVQHLVDDQELSADEREQLRAWIDEGEEQA